jgi:tetratricopeptide (TPR) repeat protein
MITSKAGINVAASIVSYLGSSAADYKQPLNDVEEDVFVEDEWEHECGASPPSLFPLPPPSPSWNCRKLSPVAPPELAIGADSIDAFRLAEVHFDTRDYECATKYLSEIIGSVPHHTPALLLRGECYHAQQQHAKAIADYNQVLEWGGARECDDARLLIADCLLAVGEQEQALLHSERAVDATRSSDAYALRGRALAKLGDIEGARRDLSQARDIASDDTHLILTLEQHLKGLI